MAPRAGSRTGRCGKPKRGLTDFVLEKTVDGYIRLEDLMYNPGLYAYYDGWQKPLKKSALSKAISRLKNKGYITWQETDDKKIIFKLTQEGKIALLLSQAQISDWDYRWRVVVFDIPEQKRKIRDLLRRNSKKWGFMPLQRSVWISKKDVTNHLINYVKDLKIEKWVYIFESDKYGSMDIN